MSLALSHTQKIDYLNIGLIVFSLVLAYLIPFQLFLFAYAVLGPLHYLTEMSWLHRSNYFIKGKHDYLILVALGIFVYHANFGIFGDPPQIQGLGTTTIFMAFVGAFCFVAFETWLPKIIGLGLAFVLGIFVFSNPKFFESYFIIIAVFVPTIVHVCVFTLLFMVYGSIKNKSKIGFVSCAVFVIACVVLFLYNPTITYQISDYVSKLYRDTFYIVNDTLMYVSGQTKSFSTEMTDEHFNTIFFSKAGVIFTRFVAFIYLYHYLNWFSKTSIIKWHEVSMDRLIVIATLWILSVGLYYYDYKLGFQVLFTLSMMHVFLEFPLNFKTIQTLAMKLVGK
jgi:hypothetical protein